MFTRTSVKGDAVTEITLGDYTGYILLEMIKAREMADTYSREVGERYAKDPLMRYFSVPRFKVPKMELTIPVLISGARFKQTVRFDLAIEEFLAIVASRVANVRKSVELSRGGGRVPDRIIEISRLATLSAAIDKLAREFHADLEANPEPLHPDTIVTTRWSQIFWKCLEEANLVDYYEQSDPKHTLLAVTTSSMLDLVRGRTVVGRTEIENLLVNPETNVVKDGSSDTSVFTVKAELLEEGFFLRSVRDEDAQEVRTIVEFE